MIRDAWDGIHDAASDRRSGAAEIVRRAAEALAALPSTDVKEAVFILVRGQPATVLPDLVVVHSFSDTVNAALATSNVRAICALSEPGGEGATTTKALVDLGVDARLVTDEEALAAVAEAGAVVVGADAVEPGGVVNKMGTFRF